MKNSLALALIGVVMLAILNSCKEKEENNITPRDTLFSVSFALEGFSQSIQDMQSENQKQTITTKAIAGDNTSYVSHIYFLIYKDGSFIKQIHQVKDNSSNFGTVQDSLSRGRYELVFLAAKDSLNLVANQHTLNLTFPGTDVFYKKITLDVEGALNNNITLERIVSKLDINIRDKVPFEVKKIELRIISGRSLIPNKLDVLSGLTIQEDESDGYGAYTQKIENSMVDKPLKLTYYILKGASGDVSLGAFDSNNMVYSNAEIPNVVMEVNKVTTLTGTLFDKRTEYGGAVINLPDTSWIQHSRISF